MLLVLVGILLFLVPGYLVTTTLDHVAVQDGVRTVLERDYQLSGVSRVVCPPGQEVLPARSFGCAVLVNGLPAEVPVVIMDRAGRYAVGRPG